MRALMLDPKVVLLDEPLGALDPLIRYDLQNELARIFDRLDKTVVLVTHDLAEAAFLSHELVLLDAGRIVQRGSLSELRRAPASDFVTRFLEAQRQLHGDAGS
jgi:osmoprotectant transport system ATP-binding protein